MRLHGVDLVLIQPFLLSYVNQAALMQLVFFKHNFHKKKTNKGGLSQNKVNLSLTLNRRLGYEVPNCKIIYSAVIVSHQLFTSHKRFQKNPVGRSFQ